MIIESYWQVQRSPTGFLSCVAAAMLASSQRQPANFPVVNTTLPLSSGDSTQSRRLRPHWTGLCTFSPQGAFWSYGLTPPLGTGSFDRRLSSLVSASKSGPDVTRASPFRRAGSMSANRPWRRRVAPFVARRPTPKPQARRCVVRIAKRSLIFFKCGEEFVTAGNLGPARLALPAASAPNLPTLSCSAKTA